MEKPKRQVHQDITNVFTVEAIEKVGNQVVFEGEPMLPFSARHVVKEKIVNITDNWFQKGEVQKPCHIADKQGGQNDAGDRDPCFAPALRYRINGPADQCERESL